jgi:hypothetical protein
MPDSRRLSDVGYFGVGATWQLNTQNVGRPLKLFGSDDWQFDSFGGICLLSF